MRLEVPKQTPIILLLSLPQKQGSPLPPRPANSGPHHSSVSALRRRKGETGDCVSGDHDASKEPGTAHQEKVRREHSGVPQVWSVLPAPRALRTAVSGLTFWSRRGSSRRLDLLAGPF